MATREVALTAATGCEVGFAASDTQNLLLRSHEAICLWQKWYRKVSAAHFPFLEFDPDGPLRIFAKDAKVFEALKARLAAL